MKISTAVFKRGDETVEEIGGMIRERLFALAEEYQREIDSVVIVYDSWVYFYSLPLLVRVEDEDVVYLHREVERVHGANKNRAIKLTISSRQER